MPYLIEDGNPIELELVSNVIELYPEPLDILRLDKILDVKKYPNKDGELNVHVHSAKMEEPSILFEYSYGFDDLFRKKQAILYRYPQYFYYDSEEKPIYVFEIGVYNNGNRNASDFFTTNMIKSPEKLLDLIIKVTSDSISDEDVPF